MTDQPEPGVWWVTKDRWCPRHCASPRLKCYVKFHKSLPYGDRLFNHCNCFIWASSKHDMADEMYNAISGAPKLKPGDGPIKVRLTMERVAD